MDGPNFADGLFGGARSVMQTYGMYQESTLRQQQIDLYERMKNMPPPAAPPPATPMGGTSPLPAQTPGTDTDTPNPRGPVDPSSLPNSKPKIGPDPGGRDTVDVDASGHPKPPPPAKPGADPGGRDTVGTDASGKPPSKTESALKEAGQAVKDAFPPATDAAGMPTSTGYGAGGPPPVAPQDPPVPRVAVPGVGAPGATGYGAGGAAPQQAQPQSQPQTPANGASPSTPITNPTTVGAARTMGAGGNLAGPMGGSSYWGDPRANFNAAFGSPQPAGTPPPGATMQPFDPAANAAPTGRPALPPIPIRPAPDAPAPGAAAPGAPASPPGGGGIGSAILGMLTPGTANAAEPQAAQGQPQGGQGVAPSPGATPQRVAAAGPGPATDAPQVAPGQKGPTQASEEQPHYTRPALNAKPALWLQTNAPEDWKMVSDIAAANRINPVRLAGHWSAESSLVHTYHDGAAGEKGPLQITSGRQATVDPKGALDPTKIRDALELAGRIIAKSDADYGRDTRTSVASYQGGDGTADLFAKDALGTAANHPYGRKYQTSMFGDRPLAQNEFPARLSFNPQAIISAATSDPKTSQDGTQTHAPDQVMRLVAQTAAAANQPMTDAWRALEFQAVAFAASRGDWAGAGHARDMIFQMMHQGSMSAMMSAYRALTGGDGVTAAQQLALSHAYFADGTMGNFGVDSKGNVWGQRVDEHDPSHTLGSAFQITPEVLRKQLIQFQNPAEFLGAVQSEDANNAKQRYEVQHGQYFADRYAEVSERLASNERNAAVRSQDNQQRMELQRQIHEQELASHERIAADKIEAARGGAARQDAIDKEIASGGANGGALFSNVSDPALRGGTASVYSALRHNAGPDGPIPADTAEDYARGVMTNRYHLQAGKDGTTYGITTAGGKVLAVVSAGVADRVSHLLQRQEPGSAPGPTRPSSSAVPARRGNWNSMGPVNPSALQQAGSETVH